MLDRSFIEKIEDLSRNEIVEVGGRRYSTKKLHPVFESEPTTIDIHTLSGVLEFIETLPESEPLIIQVRDYDRVRLLSRLFGEFSQRSTYLESRPPKIDLPFGRFMPVEEFVVFMRTAFVQTHHTDEILRVVGNLVVGAEAELADDGVTQRVTVKAGVARVAKVELPNPITLEPYRTFPEIQQPGSEFVLRIKADGEQGAKAALFEADGGAWKIKAVQMIRAWFEDRIATIRGIENRTVNIVA